MKNCRRVLKTLDSDPFGLLLLAKTPPQQECVGLSKSLGDTSEDKKEGHAHEDNAEAGVGWRQTFPTALELIQWTQTKLMT